MVQVWAVLKADKGAQLGRRLAWHEIKYVACFWTTETWHLTTPIILHSFHNTWNNKHCGLLAHSSHLGCEKMWLVGCQALEKCLLGIQEWHCETGAGEKYLLAEVMCIVRTCVLIVVKRGNWLDDGSCIWPTGKETSVDCILLGYWRKGSPNRIDALHS